MSKKYFSANYLWLDGWGLGFASDEARSRNARSACLLGNYYSLVKLN